MSGPQQQAFGVDDYDSYWRARKDRGRSGLTEIHQILISLIERYASQSDKVLDVGVGPGHVFRALQEKGYRMHGVEFADEAFALYDFPHDTIIKHDLQDGLPLQKGSPFKAVIASHIIHHMKDPSGLVHDLHSNMEPGSVLIVATQNITFALYRLRYFFYGTFPDISKGHRNFLTPYEYDRLLRAQGFEIVERVTTGRHTFLKWLAPYWFSGTIFFVCRIPK